MNPVPPRIPERLHLLRLPGDMLGVTVFDVAAGGGPLEVGVELDTVRRVDVDALHLAAQPLPLSQRGHHLQAVPENHPVRPVGIVLVELGGGCLAGKAVEVSEQIRLEGGAGVFLLCLLPPLPQIVDQHLRMHLLLNE